MAPVGLVTIHHEGGGAPSDNVQRFGHGGYCYGIGLTRWERFRSPQENWATLNFNHKDLTICLSGNRMNYSVTGNDIQLIHGAYLDCYNKKEVTADPLVRAHRNSPGSSTACPGDLTMAVFNKITAACRPGPVSPPVPPKPPSGGDDDMVVIGLQKDGVPGNQKPFGFLDPGARKVWSHWGFRIQWDGNADNSLHGTTPPQFVAVPGTAPLVGWDMLERIDNGKGARICVYGLNGAEYTGIAHS